MNIWEEVYSKHKGSGSVPVDPQIDQPLQQPQVRSDSLNHDSHSTGPGSFEERDNQTRKPPPVKQPAPERESQPVRQHTPDREPPQPQAPTKPVRSRFIPRSPSGKPVPPYPAILAKMRYSLSDCWANIMLETKQTVETLLVCGAARKEGSTLVSYHLAMFLSKEYNMKVLYMDTNLNHTPVPRIQNLPGVYSFISEKKDLASLIVKTEYPGFFILPSGAGKVAKNVGSNMLSREPIETMLHFCRDNFDLTIIDGQPLVSSPVMIEFARMVDMTVLVCRYAFSRKEVSKMAIDKLQKFGITSIGVILNDRQFPVPQKVYKWLG